MRYYSSIALASSRRQTTIALILWCSVLYTLTEIVGDHLREKVCRCVHCKVYITEAEI